MKKHQQKSDTEQNVHKLKPTSGRPIGGVSDLHIEQMENLTTEEIEEMELRESINDWGP